MAGDFEAWFDDLKLRGANRESHRRVYQSAYNRGQRNRLCTMNPLEGIEHEKSDEVLPTPFTVKATRAILSAAEKYASVMVPSLAVQFFAGLRPGESYGLVWQHVDFTGKTVRVMPEVSKRRRTRIVDMSPTLAAWLAPYAKDTGLVGGPSKNSASYYMNRKPCGKKTGLLAAAGIEWIQDGPRRHKCGCRSAYGPRHGETVGFPPSRIRRVGPGVGKRVEGIPQGVGRVGQGARERRRQADTKGAEDVCP